MPNVESILIVAGKITARLRLIVTWLVIGFFGYMAVAVLIQVVGRYVFNYSIDWAAETATFAQIWMILLAAGLAMRTNLHVSVDALTNILPVPILRFLIVVIVRLTSSRRAGSNAARITAVLIPARPSP